MIMIETGVFMVMDTEKYARITDASESPHEVRVLSANREKVDLIEVWNSDNKRPRPHKYSPDVVEKLQKDYVIKKDRSM